MSGYSHRLLISLFYSLIQGLQHSRIHGRNHIDRGVQLFLGHPRFPCVRKAPVHSRIAKAHHRDSEPHEHFLTFAQAFDGMRIAIESSEISFLHSQSPLLRNSSAH